MFFDELCKWQYDADKDCLTVLLSSKNSVKTTLKKHHLNHMGLQQNTCDLPDFELFSDFMRQLEVLNFNYRDCEMLAYSAVAANRFLVPNQPKSWYFHEQSTSLDPENKLARAMIKQDRRWCNFLIAAIDGVVATVLLLDNSLQLPGLTLSFGEPFRIFTNRLESSEVVTASHYYLQSA
ncbi:hypothetical protein CEP49_01600 [Mergibacter septicus]|uniref:cell division protein ZapC domain-containing protein n=1 Tax=Mergibacter septicus TaxID=221402 RepID=UPI0011792A4B|nr:cell division protein ZapC domain-containing protein [Mergibacter septicus]AWX13331.1 hypothetical protein CEP49_01600 [Mergibacter septicus]